MREVYRAEFEYSKKVPFLVRKVVEWQFMKARSEAAKVVNAHYPKWNQEIMSLNKKIYDYQLFAKEEMLLRQFNDEHSYLVELHADIDEYCDIFGVFYWWFGYTEVHLAFFSVFVD